MTDHLNYFEPYSRKEAHHEDQLTRAFIVILRHVPMAHAGWLGLVDRSLRQQGHEGIGLLQELPSPIFEIQRSEIPTEVSEVVSLIQTDDHYFDDRPVSRSDRGQVLDAIVSYPPDVAVVMENKPSVSKVRFEQLSISTPEETEVVDVLASVSWREVISMFGNLVSTGQVTGAEETLVEDFLNFVDERFPKLQPFDRVSLCGTSAYRLRRRCRAVLEEIAPEHVRYHKGWAWHIELGRKQAARMAALAPRVQEATGTLRLMFAPGDTMSQARRLYKALDRERVDRLLKAGWKVTTNFHLSFMARNLVRTNTQMSVVEYVDYWVKHQGDLQQVSRERFASFFDHLVNEGLAVPEDRSEFERRFLNTERQRLNVCPGLGVSRQWTLEEAAELDDAGRFVNAVRLRIEEALATWDGRLPQQAD